jgi:hypothetical protein
LTTNTNSVSLLLCPAGSESQDDSYKLLCLRLPPPPLVVVVVVVSPVASRTKASNKPTTMSSSPAMFNGDEVATFFGFMGAASALVFSCKFPHLAAVQQQQLSSDRLPH